MSFKTPFLLAATALCTLLVGCSSQETPSTDSTSKATPAASASGRCNSDTVQDLVGKALSPALVEQSRQRAGAQTARVVRPQDPMSMDFNSQRLSITTSETLVVQTVSCG